MTKEPIQLSDHFTYNRLLRFTGPSITMMLFLSIYSVIDGLMVSNFVGTVSFAALNLIWPYVAIIGSLGFMLGTGGSALVAKIMGEGDIKRARGIFSFLVYSTFAISIIGLLVGLIFVRPMSVFLGAEGEMIEECVTYATILLYLLPTYMFQVFFQSFLVTAEKPKWGMWITISAGVTNAVLDYVFIALFDWGLAGAAWASGIGMIVASMIPLIYFIGVRHKDERPKLYLCKPYIDMKALWKVCSNGVSEFAMNISISIVSMIYMYQLIRWSGENGVSAYGILMYYAFIFTSLFIGYSMGIAPVISYHYGAKNHDELKNLFTKSLRLIICTSVVVVILAQIFAEELAGVFIGYDAKLEELTTHALRVYMLFLLVAGINTFSSALFTALNNGPISCLIALSRTVIFEAGSVMILPLFFGMEGVWWSVVVGETIAACLAITLVISYKNKYHYL
ncbi:MAG: MATE family efflux transporter [Bacteroidia bacterium]|nr:MATE family efflux transporter [Bacteroidia bacterium]